MKNQSKTIIKMYHKVFRICFEHELVSHRFGLMKKYFALIRSSFHPPIYYIFECFLFLFHFRIFYDVIMGFRVIFLFVQKISRVFVQNIIKIKGINNNRCWCRALRWKFNICNRKWEPQWHWSSKTRWSFTKKHIQLSWHLTKVIELCACLFFRRNSPSKIHRHR